MRTNLPTHPKLLNVVDSVHAVKKPPTNKPAKNQPTTNLALKKNCKKKKTKTNI